MKKYFIFFMIISNLLAFDFYGLKSGMSYDDVVNNYFNFNISSFCESYVPIKNENAEYSFEKTTMEKCMETSFDYYTKAGNRYRIEKIEYEIMRNESIPYLKNISLSFTPNNEALLSVSVIFDPETSGVGLIAFEKILNKTFPSAFEIEMFDENKFIITFLDSEITEKWINVYYDKLNKF